MIYLLNRLLFNDGVGSMSSKIAKCSAGCFNRDLYVLYSSSDGCLWILNSLLSNDANKLQASVTMKAKWQWIFSLKLARSKQLYTEDNFAIQQSKIERAQNRV